jgi:molecular chaperone GrpE
MNAGEDDATQGRPKDARQSEPHAAADAGAAPGQPLSGAEGASAAEELDPVSRELSDLKRSFEENQVRLREVSKAYTELTAEMKAFKERMEHRARVDSESQAYDQVKAFFEPVMNLKRSLSASGSDPASLVQGLHMVLHQFLEALHKLGLAEIPGEGASFDPRFHEALAVQPVSDPALDGRVLVVHTTGFVVNGRVLQPAQVVIGKMAETAGEA